MDRYIHYLGFVGDSRRPAVTIAITRGTAKADALFLLTKAIEAISRNDLPQNELGTINEVRIGSYRRDTGDPA